jgi:uncharacterized membrane protein YdjX (TVP38/TMEM64 family)
MPLPIKSHLMQRAIVITILVAALVVVGYWLEQHIAAIEAWIAGLGHWAGFGFIILFLVLTPVFFSVDAMCILAGALFTLPMAIGYVLLATMLSAAVMFYIGRHVAGDKVRILLRKRPKLSVVDEIIGEGGFKIMYLLRLLPLPFALMSYVYSVSRIRFMPYWLATSGIFFYHAAITYFGFTAKHMSKQLSQGGDYAGPHGALLFAGILVAVIVMVIISRYAKAEIASLHSTKNDLF